MSSRRIPLLSLTLGILLAVRAADTSSAPAPEAPFLTPEKSQVGEIGEIIVTARKREESLLEVPVSMSVISGNEILARGSQDIRDLQNSVPNFSWSGNNTNMAPSVLLRGINSFVQNNGFESGIGFYVDGVVMADPEEANIDLFDVDRVEVLRGPQGTLFGRNATGGIVNVITKAPTDHLEVDAQAETGNLNLRSANAAVRLPLGTEWRGSLSVFTTERDGYLKNLGPAGGTLGGWGRSAARGALVYEPSDALKIDLRTDYLNDTGATPNAWKIASGPGSSEQPGWFTMSQNTPAHEQRRQKGVSGTVTAVMPAGYVLTSVSALRDSVASGLLDDDFTAMNIATNGWYWDRHQFTQELRFESSKNNSLQWLLGTYYFRHHANTKQIIGFGPDFVGVIPGFFTDIGRINTDAYAAFFNATWDISTRLNIFAGARYTSEHKHAFYQQFGIAADGLPDLGPIGPSRTDHDISPTAGASIALNESRSLRAYCKYSRGFKSGGFNTELLDTLAYFTFAPEKVDTFEVGVKSPAFARRGFAMFSVFYSDYTNMQVNEQYIRSDGIQDSRINNAGHARISGAEMEVSASVGKLLEVSSGIGYAGARFITYLNGGGLGTNADGNRLAQVPKITASLSARYTPEISDVGRLVFLLQANYKSDVFHDSSNDPVGYIPGFVLVKASLGWEPRGGRWHVTLWSDNLLDRRYVTSAVNNQPGQLVILGEERTYGVRVAYAFR
jgi:iron complex outermembrane receptor protein